MSTDNALSSASLDYTEALATHYEERNALALRRLQSEGDATGSP